MASKIKVDQIAESTSSANITFQNDVIVPTGKTITIADGVPVASGGTGLASFTAGDVLYATGSTTLAKLAKGTAEQVLAMNAGATAPDWGSVDLTVLPTISVAKGGTSFASFTAGDILYATGATTLAKLAKGTAAQALQMNAGATAPEWVTAAGGGAYTFIDSGTWTGVSSVDLGATLTGSYDTHVLMFDTYRAGSGQLYMQVEIGSTWYGNSNNYSTNHHSTSHGSTVGEYGDTGTDYIRLSGDGFSNEAVNPGFWTMTLRNLLSSTENPNYTWSATTTNQDSTTNVHHLSGGGQTDQTGTVTDIKLLVGASTFAGQWALYGIKNA